MAGSFDDRQWNTFVATKWPHNLFAYAIRFDLADHAVSILCTCMVVWRTICSHMLIVFSVSVLLQ
ncbi:hypothetical protein SERLA73DRAFT_178592 [Serpula lacrymans var. lacrymans S7.3]|uniref:SWIM-type domain-containing protein n=2 Tax=Serpula lacrymans var. lacrymans TaxID=341189 RepID=F8PS89_SERL3|nr:uncharacterized protein SERLADRAFT_463091 [Serpula lacrymans var. lacrymans S7.9]EGO00702.1 hypothetical protein SERLA73DRAFT_178592 [Serpula lacrymans var. lacrymans S7.3]EGO26250.1 hypothetical protein SERLADRAFT_463091 [Serpula lacrymans var. lacrymans S7.9]